MSEEEKQKPIRFKIQRFDPEENQLRRKVEECKHNLEQAEPILEFLLEERKELEIAVELMGRELAKLLRETFLERGILSEQTSWFANSVGVLLTEWDGWEEVPADYALKSADRLVVFLRRQKAVAEHELSRYKNSMR